MVVPGSPPRDTTLECEYTTKVQSLLEGGNEEDAVDYMLKAVPFIQEYARDVDEDSSIAKASHLDEYGFHVTSTQSKKEIFSRYMAEMEEDYSYIFERQPKTKAANRGTNRTEWECQECHVSKVFVQTEAQLVCPSCGIAESFIEINQNNLSFDEQVSSQVNNHCAYKRVNHFSEWINSLQGRESTHIPEEVLDAVRMEFKKHRITDVKDITPTHVKKHLKKLRLSKWYEHVHAICQALGTPPPTLSPSLERALKNMFAEIQAPFNKHVKRVAPTRKNFLSYAYVLYKFCELLGETDLMQHFSLLKSHEKLHQMDMIWKCICEELQWEFVPSL
jgi:rubrerythrin